MGEDRPEQLEVWGPPGVLAYDGKVIREIEVRSIVPAPGDHEDRHNLSVYEALGFEAEIDFGGFNSSVSSRVFKELDSYINESSLDDEKFIVPNMGQYESFKSHLTPEDVDKLRSDYGDL